MSTVPRAAVGRHLGTSLYKVSADDMKAYARATNDERPEYLDESRVGGIIAPPLFAVVAELPLYLQSVFSLSLSLDRLLHGEQDMKFISPIRPGDVLKTEASIVDVCDTTTGQTVTSEVVTSTREGEPRARTLFRQYVRRMPIRRSSQAEAKCVPFGTPHAETTVTVRSDQATIYAQASGDYAAPHFDEAFARAIGFRTAIIQGLCTMALISGPIVDSACQGDPTRLKRLKVRFSSAVYPRDVLTTTIWKREEEEYHFLTTNQDGVNVITNGVAQVRP